MIETLTYIFNPDHVRLLLRGARITVEVTLLSGVFGLILGMVAALGRMAPSRIAKLIAGIYIEFFRGTPLLVQLFIVYFGLPSLPFVDPMPAYWAGVTGLSLYAGAYFSEIIRGAFAAIPSGQNEAARVLGFGPPGTYRFVLIPQAIRNAVPALGNQFISLIKDSSLVSIITVTDLLQAGRTVINRTFEPLIVYLAVALVYLLLSNLSAAAVGAIERHYNKPYRRTG